MTSINRLNNKENPVKPDLVPIYDSESDRTRNTSMGGIVELTGDEINPMTDVSSTDDDITFEFYNGSKKVVDVIRNDHSKLSNRNAVDAHNASSVQMSSGSSVESVVSSISVGTISDLRAVTNVVDGWFIIVNDSGLRYKITSSPESIPGFTPSLMVNDDDSTFIKLAAGLQWAVIDTESESGGRLVRSRWPSLYGKFLHKCRVGDAVKIATFGDSTVFCQGTVGKADSVNRIGDPTNFGDGSTYNNWQLITPWPTIMQSHIASAYGITVNLENRGYSGDSVYQVVQRHITPTGADLATLMIGINDCAYATSNHTVTNGVLTAAGYNLDAFSTGLKQVLIRETLRGVAMVLQTCVAQASNVGFDGTINSGNILTEAYNDVIRAVGKDFCIPVIETESDMLASYPIYPRVILPSGEQAGITHDGVHFDPYGANIIASRLLACFTGKSLIAADRVSAGSKQLANYFQSSVTSNAVLSNSANSTAPYYLDQTNPQSINLTAGQFVYFSFYAETDDLIAHPSGSISNGGVTTIELDLSVQQPEFRLDTPSGQQSDSNRAGSRPESSKTIEGSASQSTFGKRGAALKGIHVATRGWHTIKVTCAAGTAEVYGLQFSGQDSFTPSGVFIDEYLLSGTLGNSGQQVAYTSDSDYEDITVDFRANVNGSLFWVKARLTKIGTTYSAEYIAQSSGLRVEWSGDNVVIFNDTAGNILVNFASVYIFK